jgi:hypothetical protein
MRVVGPVVALYWTLRRLSLSPTDESALIKAMGTQFERDVIGTLHTLVDREPVPASPSRFERLLHRATLENPSGLIRDGAKEVLDSVAAKRRSSR